MLIIHVLFSIVCGLVSYSFLINERGKFGQGDTVDKVLAILMGICGFLVFGAFAYA